MFDVIVIGSGMSGGIAAKELCEAGLKVLMLERGRDIDPSTDYTDMVMPWEFANGMRVPEDEIARDYPVQSQCYAFSAATKHYWVKDSEHPYTTADGGSFSWIRGYHTGGRSIMWGRQSFRLCEMDFEANAKDGHGCDWPIRYADLAPWYDRIEKFIGVAGSRDGLAQLPDGEHFLPPFELNDGEKQFKAAVEAKWDGRKVIIGRTANLSVAQPWHEELGRSTCQNRSICDRGCSFGAMHSTLTSSLPAARRTNNLTLVTDAIVHSIITDPKTGRATGVRVIDRNTKVGRVYEARVVFLNASAINSAAILLNSANARHPNGLANGSDQVGRNLMDHLLGPLTIATVPGPQDSYYKGRRPAALYIPRYRNFVEDGDGYARGYGFSGQIMRASSVPQAQTPGLGAALKDQGRRIGPWVAMMGGFGEMLPNPDNRVTLGKGRDQWGMPIPHIACAFGPNEEKMARQMTADGRALLEAAGGTIVSQASGVSAPGSAVHEMGTVRMGRDPRTSVLNGWNQAHEVPNLFCTDGGAMASAGCVNPSLTYMAMTARAADHAVTLMKDGTL
ncbi:GMC family oxidoreductase [Sphingobium sp. HBC34]|uniref:GMC family oxidoreductase n=1 Tax=Sphingobium cyanobacteriorum TaxID=3063954 RepID=A0ABT8ZRC3_9SPHN|nr:GMC family oxidoreductase [Sphingobium sp. HBC34]MDO7836633.1 GMC family oxidoreductase [Sphingobium sp. HBC34]